MTPGELAAAAAENVWELKVTTTGGHRFENAAEACQVLASLAKLAQQLPQAIEQAMAWLAREQAAGRLRDDREYAMAMQWHVLVEQADSAEARAKVLATRLAALAEEASFLGSVDVDESVAKP